MYNRKKNYITSDLFFYGENSNKTAFWEKKVFFREHSKEQSRWIFLDQSLVQLAKLSKCHTTQQKVI